MERRRYTVPHDPFALGEVPGKLLRVVFKAARLATEAGHTADSLQKLPRWKEVSPTGSAVRTAVRWGLIR